MATAPQVATSLSAKPNPNSLQLSKVRSRSILLLVAAMLIVVDVSGEASSKEAADPKVCQSSAGHEWARTSHTANNCLCDAPESGEKPFLYHGRGASDGDLEFAERFERKFGAAMEKFPNAGSCIAPLENRSEMRSESGFNWQNLSSNEEAEVCLFRVLSGLETLKEIQEWLEREGLELSESRDYTASQLKNAGLTGSVTEVSMRWNNKEKGALYGRGFAAWRSSLLAKSYTVSIAHSSQCGLIAVQVLGHSTWGL